MTLRTKTGLCFALLVVAAVALSGFILLRQAETALRGSIHAGVSAVASTAANQLAGDLARSRTTVGRFATALPEPLPATDPQRLGEALSAFHREAPQFAGGFLLLDVRGRLLAAFPPRSGPHEKSFADEEFFRRGREAGERVAVVPRRSRETGEPVLTFSAPLNDEQGAFRGLLAASIPLRSPSVFSGLRLQAFGTSGYLYVYDSTRQLILHPQDRRLLQRDVPPGANALFDAALAGYEGVGETVNSRGIPMLLALRRVPGTDWILGAQQPVDEALAPLREAQRSQLLVLLAGGITAALAGWWLSGRLARPLTELRAALDGLEDRPSKTESVGQLSPSTLKRQDEIGALARSFKALRRSLAKSHSRLDRSELEWQRTFDGVRDALLILDGEHRIRRLNRAAAELLNLSPEEALGMTSCRLLHGPDVTPESCPFGNPVLASGSVKMEEIAGRPGHFEIHATAIQDDRGGPGGSLYLIRDLTAWAQTEKQLLQLAHYDSLTGLPNRRLMVQQLDQALLAATADQELLGILHLDLDRFKLINDSLGHEQGDRMIQILNSRILSLLGEEELACRAGSDEWILAVVPASARDMSRRLERLLKVISEPVELSDGRRVQCSASIGAVLFPEHGRHPETLLRNAEIALFQAKEAGRGGFRLYSPRLSEKALQRSLLAINLRHALEREELDLHYQPKIDLESGRVVGMEALLRWNSPEMGSVPPGKFVPMAEELGLIEVMGEWVLRMACAQTRILHLEGFSGLQVSVNLSPLQLRQSDLTERIARILEETGLDPDHLELELTETMVMSNLRGAARKLRDLGRMGVRIAIDDFGTGYSALNYLKRLPISRLKIDRTFVEDIDRNPNDASIADIILTIAHSMDLRVTAEGVETEAQLHILMEGGCEEAQGHYFSPAVPPGELRRLLAMTHALPDLQIPASNEG